MNRTALVSTALVAGALAAGGVLLAWRGDGATPGHAPTAASRLERGGYLVRTSGCTDCHTPWTMGPDGPTPDVARGLSGHPEGLRIEAPPPAQPMPWLVSSAATNTAHAGPWGVSFTANLTPDVETGIGGWTPDTFRAALRTGRHMGRGRPILPPMPWPVYGQMTDEDLDSIFAWLTSQPAVRNRVPEPLAPAPAPGAPAATASAAR